MEPTTFVGLDVHKRMTSVAIAESGRGGEVRFLGEIPSTPEALCGLVQRLQTRYRRLSFCPENKRPSRRARVYPARGRSMTS
jgi:transposase